MMKVLLADDEFRTLRHLETGIAWKQLGLVVCATASNGQEVLNYIENHPIDILITDVRMPGMDGLELCSRIREMKLEIQIILLTGYADFEYARRGISLKVVDYCLKPIDIKQLSETLHRTVRSRYDDTTSYADTLLDLIEKGESNEIQKAFSDLGLSGRGVYLAGSIGVHNIEKQLNAALSCKVGKHKYLYFSQNPLNKEAAAKIIAFASKRSGIGMMPDLIPYSNMSHAVDDVLVMTLQYFVNGMPTLCDQLVDGPLIQDVFMEFAQIKDSPALLKSWLLNLSQANCSLLFNIRSAFRFFNQVTMCPSLQSGGGTESYLYGFEQMAADYDCFTDILTELGNAVCSDTSDPQAAFEGPDSFLAIMKYLNDNFQHDISLKRISENLHLNPSYISQLVKNETGATYTQYVTELRMEKAKELLKTTKLSLSEISEAVGFNDYFYFIKKFKREVGVTPGKFLQYEKGMDLLER